MGVTGLTGAAAVKKGHVLTGADKAAGKAFTPRLPLVSAVGPVRSGRNSRTEESKIRTRTVRPMRGVAPDRFRRNLSLVTPPCTKFPISGKVKNAGGDDGFLLTIVSPSAGFAKGAECDRTKRDNPVFVCMLVRSVPKTPFRPTPVADAVRPAGACANGHDLRDRIREVEPMGPNSGIARSRPSDRSEVPGPRARDRQSRFPIAGSTGATRVPSVAGMQIHRHKPLTYSTSFQEPGPQSLRNGDGCW